MKKSIQIFIHAMPVIVMVSFLFFTTNTYLLVTLYTIPAIIYFVKKPKIINYLVYATGFFCMTFFESIFLLTKVETFADKSLFGIMPLWLPFLWAYGFLAIKDSLNTLTKAD